MSVQQHSTNSEAVGQDNASTDVVCTSGERDLWLEALDSVYQLQRPTMMPEYRSDLLRA